MPQSDYYMVIEPESTPNKIKEIRFDTRQKAMEYCGKKGIPFYRINHIICS